MGSFKIYITWYLEGHWIKTCQTGKDKKRMGEQIPYTAYGGHPEGNIRIMREE